MEKLVKVTSETKKWKVYKQLLQSVPKSLWNSGMAQMAVFRYTMKRVEQRKL